MRSCRSLLRLRLEAASLLRAQTWGGPPAAPVAGLRRASGGALPAWDAEAEAAASGEGGGFLVPLVRDEATLTTLSPADVGRFFVFSEADEAALLPDGLPVGMADEFALAPGRRLLARQSFLTLRDHVLNSTAARPAEHRVLEGLPGAGKSVLLALTVAAARQAGWLALYVPRGRSLTTGSPYAKHEPKRRLTTKPRGAAGGAPSAEPAAPPPPPPPLLPPRPPPLHAMWNTPDHARRLAGSLVAAHGELLASLPRKAAGAAPGATLRSLADAARSATAAPAAVVDAWLDLVDELKAVSDVRVLFAVDELNALSAWTTYHEVVGPKSRRRMHAGELRVAESLRSLPAAPFPSGLFLGAVSSSVGVSPRVACAGVPRSVRRSVPRFALDDTRLLLRHYAFAGAAPRLRAADGFDIDIAAPAAHALSVGSGTLLRNSVVLL